MLQGARQQGGLRQVKEVGNKGVGGRELINNNKTLI